MNEKDNEDTDDDGTRWLAHRQQKVSYPSLAKVGRKPRQNERNDAIELQIEIREKSVKAKERERERERKEEREEDTHKY
jgi:hypothetical protein